MSKSRAALTRPVEGVFDVAGNQFLNPAGDGLVVDAFTVPATWFGPTSNDPRLLHLHQESVETRAANTNLPKQGTYGVGAAYRQCSQNRSLCTASHK